MQQTKKLGRQYKGCPKCNHWMIRLYKQAYNDDKKRRWIGVLWLCAYCGWLEREEMINDEVEKD